ncbi:MAG: hypothetical protein R3F46_09855 [bacterium]
MYWSTETPINFETAAYATAVNGIWFSSVLLNQEYHFAVRVSDTADPLTWTITGVELSIVPDSPRDNDQQPPYWADVDGLKAADFQPASASIRVGDGFLRIECAAAVDLESTPVHYDLYLLPAIGTDRLIDQFCSAVPEAIVIKDIPLCLTALEEQATGSASRQCP